MLLNAQMLRDDDGDEGRIMLVMEDVTEEKLTGLQDRHGVIFYEKNQVDPVIPSNIAERTKDIRQDNGIDVILISINPALIQFITKIITTWW